MSTSARVLRPMPAVAVDPYDVSNYPGPAPWRDDAACFGDNPDLFFPDLPTGCFSPETEARARQVCAKCPVQTKCLSEAIATEEEYGIRGGVNFGSPRERQRMMRGGAA